MHVLTLLLSLIKKQNKKRSFVLSVSVCLSVSDLFFPFYFLRLFRYLSFIYFFFFFLSLFVCLLVCLFHFFFLPSFCLCVCLSCIFLSFFFFFKPLFICPFTCMLGGFCLSFMRWSTANTDIKVPSAEDSRAIKTIQ